MKKLLFSILLAGTLSGFSQTAVKEGNFIIDGYYGYPNLFASFLKTAYSNSGILQQDFKVGSIGPVGGRFEYLLTDKIGLGFESNYTDTYVQWTELSSTPSGGTAIYTYKVSAPRIRFMPRFNLHFGKSEKVDGFFGVAAGYGKTTLKFETDDPSYVFSSISGIPFAMRVGVGLRYFFIPNFGASLEFGVGGGPLLAAGLSGKF